MNERIIITSVIIPIR